VEEVVHAELSGAVLVEGGAARRDGKRIGGTTRVPRVMVPRDLSLNGLILRVAGVIEG